MKKFNWLSSVLVLITLIAYAKCQLTCYNCNACSKTYISYGTSSTKTCNTSSLYCYVRIQEKILFFHQR